MLTVDLACDRLVRWWIDSMVFQTLMIPMAMIVVDVFFNGPAKRAQQRAKTFWSFVYENSTISRADARHRDGWSLLVESSYLDN